MSHKADRLRAQSGTIFRNGQLVKAEDWYAAHPTKEMATKQKQDVSRAVGAELDKKFGGEAAVDKSYSCSKCGRNHRPGTIIYREHLEFKEE